MIGYVRGIVTHLFKESCYVDVHGVGYRVYVPTTTRQQLIEGHEATLFTYLNVREDAMQLYGFWTEEEYELFILLISVFLIFYILLKLEIIILLLKFYI